MGDLVPKITVNLGDTIPFLWEKFLKIIGKDSDSRELSLWFGELLKIGFVEASTVQCIGMHTPVPLEDIYRPTKLQWQTAYMSTFDFLGKKQDLELPKFPITPAEFMRSPISAAIIAGPGWGKTTFLHHLFLSYVKSEEFVPILVTLRRSGSVEDLTRLISTMLEQKQLSRSSSVLLLVDGYDELSVQSRKKVSQQLQTFISLGTGRLYLSCREFYDIVDLHLPRAKVAAFDDHDQEKYVASFTKAYGTKVDAAALLTDLRSRGLQDLLKHPLLLTLVCIVKSGSMSLYSRSVLVLIERALDTLSFRWDEGKGLAREQTYPLDGRSRIHCLMRIAYYSPDTLVSDREVTKHAKEQLEKLRWDDLDPRQVMLETARFYGILVPVDEENWQFVHKTLHDYLAARYMIETGQFNPKSIHKWTSRHAYAACLSADATAAMLQALSSKDSFPAFVEMLSNDAAFDHRQAVEALIDYYQKFPRTHFYEVRGSDRTSMALASDYISIASTKFLQSLAYSCCQIRGKARDTFFAYAIAELLDRRQVILPETIARAWRTFKNDHKFVMNHGGAWKTLSLRQLSESSEGSTTPQ